MSWVTKGAPAKVGLAIIALLLMAGVVGPAQAAPNWRTAGGYKTHWLGPPNGAAYTNIVNAKRVRFVVRSSRTNQTVRYEWWFKCWNTDGDSRRRAREGTWNTGDNARKIFEPNLPFADSNRIGCVVNLYTKLRTGGDPGTMLGKIQWVKD